MKTTTTTNSTTTQPAGHTLMAGYGFDVGQNFARAAQDTPIELAPDEYAKPGCVIGYIAENPASSLGFLRYGHNGRIRVHCMKAAIARARGQGVQS